MFINFSDIPGHQNLFLDYLYEFNNIKVMPTFHPSYVIRNEGNKEIKKMVWEDMQKVMAFLGKK